MESRQILVCCARLLSEFSEIWDEGSIPLLSAKMEVVRLVEETVLKTAGCKSLGDGPPLRFDSLCLRYKNMWPNGKAVVCKTTGAAWSPVRFDSRHVLFYRTKQ